MSGETIVRGIILLYVGVWGFRRIREVVNFFTDRQRYEIIRSNQRAAKDAEFAASAPYALAGAICVFVCLPAAPLLFFIALVAGWLARIRYRA